MHCMAFGIGSSALYGLWLQSSCSALHGFGKGGAVHCVVMVTGCSVLHGPGKEVQCTVWSVAQGTVLYMALEARYSALHSFGRGGAVYCVALVTRCSVLYGSGKEVQCSVWHSEQDLALCVVCGSRCSAPHGFGGKVHM